MRVEKALRALKRRILGRPGRGHGHHLSDAEILARTEEFNRNAERHWSEIAAEPEGKRHHLDKPVSTVADTADIFYRLGLVLDALDLGVGHTVLDFGAGACWLSSILNRLRCRTVSLDVSPTALALGRELFALDPRHRMDLDPRFLHYDGHRIPLPDGSVDRVVCFDAFHHVPNGEEVLGEIFRVLRRGGRAVFAEPGEEHSHMDHSALEAERCGILENDFHLDRFLAQAEAIGFDGAFVKPYPAADLTLAPDRYFAFVSGRTSAFPLSRARAQMRDFSIFALLKGTPVRDSRKPGAFTARIVVPEDRRTIRGRRGEPVSIPARVENTGDTVWLHAPDAVGGYVALGAFLFDDAGALLSRGDARAPLPRDVAPGEAVEVSLDLRLPKDPGRYRARLDVVSEFIAWGAQHGSETPEVELVVEGYVDSSEPLELAARLERLGGAGALETAPGDPVMIPLRATNVGDTRWKHVPPGARGVVAVGAHLFASDESVVSFDLLRAPLPAEVEPGGTVDVSVTFRASNEPGRYRLELDLVDEGIAWFGHRGSPTVNVTLLVS